VCWEESDREAIEVEEEVEVREKKRSERRKEAFSYLSEVSVNCKVDGGVEEEANVVRRLLVKGTCKEN